MRIELMVSGVTRQEDAALAVRLGATWIGCTISAESPRGIDPAHAKEIFSTLGKKVRGVLEFRRAPVADIQAAAAAAGAKAVRCFGTPEADLQVLEKGGLTVFRIHDIPSGCNLLPNLAPEPSEKSPAIMQPSSAGNGLTFPWEILGEEAPHATFISGGVRPENVCALITHTPYGIDICSGIESAPGIKDHERMRLFFQSASTRF